jgi:hypothetical protein
MAINGNIMKIKLENYYKPTPKYWMRVGDAILYGCTALTPVVMGSPMTDNHKAWVVTVLGFIGVAAKFFTNLLTDLPAQVNEQEP